MTLGLRGWATLSGVLKSKAWRERAAEAKAGYRAAVFQPSEARHQLPLVSLRERLIRPRRYGSACLGASRSALPPCGRA
jgi:hypothetical protein